jgi:transposase-like protein
MARRYGEQFKRQAVEMIIQSGKTQRQVARELDVSEYSLNLWKKAYLGQQKPADLVPKGSRRRGFGLFDVVDSSPRSLR